MKKTTLTLLLAWMFSCTGDKNDEIPIFNGLYFKLKEGEHAATIDRSVKDKYDLLFNDNSVQMPLFRFIKHKNYEIFIGIPVSTDVRTMSNDRLRKQDSLVTQVSLDTSASRFFRSYNRNNAYIEEYVSGTTGNTMIFLAATGSLKDTSAKYLKEFELSKRINVKN